MSTFYALYQRDGSPVNPELIARLDDAMSLWQPDDRGHWCQGAAALSHFSLWNTPDSKYEKLPAQQGHLVVSCDVRLDNRDELQQRLSVRGDPESMTTDSAFLLAAYEKWGEKCPCYLLGDFSFIIWDVRKEHFFCVRDHLGVKPFYFHLTDELFFCGNDLKAMAQHPTISSDLDDEAAANYLVHSLLVDKHKTLLRAFKKLPAGYSMVVSGSTCCLDRYWRPEDAPRVKLADGKTYANELRRLLEQAVYARMRSDYRLTSHLSGGLDSSVIAVLAARKLKEQGQTLLAFNWLHQPQEGDDPNYYEWGNSRSVAAKEGIEHYYVNLETDDLYQQMVNHDIAHGDTAGFWYESVVRRACKQEGSRTLLSGWGGDEFASYHGQSYFSDLFLGGQWFLCWRDLRKLASGGKSFYRNLLANIYHAICLPLVPRRIYSFMPRRPKNTISSPRFLKPEFTETVRKEAAKETTLSMQAQPRIREHMLAYLHYGHLQARMESWAASAVEQRLEYRYPLLDKRIVEFVLGIPAKFFVKEGGGRFLFRAAANGLLSEEILWADVKREPQRVERLFQMIYKAERKLFAALCAQGGEESCYGALDLLQEQLSCSLPDEEYEKACFILDLHNILTLMLSEKKVDKM